MAHAIRIHKTGGPEVLQWEEVSVPQPGAGEALIRHKAVGLNYIDTYHRSGLYPMPMPSGIGLEAAGVVEAVGPGVTEFKAGRSRGLRQRAHRRVLGAEGPSRRPPGEDSRRHQLRAGREHDAAGPHGAVPAAPHARRAQGGRHHPVARGRRRHRPHRLPVGEGARREPDRHREHRGEGEARARARRGAHRSSTRRRISSRR